MICLNEVSKNFGLVTAIANLTLKIRDGEFTLVHGPSGSGKTTLLRLIAGLETPDKGEIWIADRLVSSPSIILPPGNRRIGMVFQRNALWPHMTVSRNILFAINGLDGREQHRRLKQLLVELSLDNLANRFPAQLSGGEARRVALARAVAGRPHLLLLDEPLVNLDPELKTRVQVWLLNEIASIKPTVLFVTHEDIQFEIEPCVTIHLEGGMRVD